MGVGDGVVMGVSWVCEGKGHSSAGRAGRQLLVNNNTVKKCYCCVCSGTLLASRKKSDMMVLLERENGEYTAGETVRGRVHIILTQDVNVKGLM